MMRVGGELICCRRIEWFLSERTWRRSVVGESLCIWRGGYKVFMNSPTHLNIVSLRILRASNDGVAEMRPGGSRSHLQRTQQ